MKKKIVSLFMAATLCASISLCSCGKEVPFGKEEVVERKLSTVNYQVPKEWAEETSNDVNVHFPGGTADPNASYIMTAFIDDQPFDEYIDGIAENGAENFEKEEVTIDGTKGYKVTFTMQDETGDASCIMYSVSTDDGIFTAAYSQSSNGEDYSDYIDKLVHTVKFK